MKQSGWFIPMTMIGLARQFDRSPRSFTSTELFAWLPELESSKVARLACTLLKQRGVLTQVPHAVPGGMHHPATAPTWQLTEDGLEICQATLQASVRKANGETLATQRPKGNTLRYRLWALLRIRTALTSEDALAVLADAGDDTSTLQRHISKQLREWSIVCPDAVQISAKRVDGRIRYVLVHDLGAMPPATADKTGGKA